jgi:hypothetical protein
MIIGELTDSPAKRISEYKRRRKSYIEQNFRPEEEAEAVVQGWSLKRENKADNRYRKDRDIEENVANEFWRLLYDFGYPRLNTSRKFHLQIQIKKDETRLKDFDIFAYDSETIIVAECRAYEKRTKSSLRIEIDDFAADQKKLQLN